MTTATLAALADLSDTYQTLDATADDIHQQRIQLIRQAKQDGIPVTLIVEAARISRARYYQLIERGQQ